MSFWTCVIVSVTYHQKCTSTTFLMFRSNTAYPSETIPYFRVRILPEVRRLIVLWPRCNFSDASCCLHQSRHHRMSVDLRLKDDDLRQRDDNFRQKRFALRWKNLDLRKKELVLGWQLYDLESRSRHFHANKAFDNYTNVAVLCVSMFLTHICLLINEVSQTFSPMDSFHQRKMLPSVPLCLFGAIVEFRQRTHSY